MNSTSGSGWLPETRGYALFAACRASEAAFEDYVYFAPNSCRQFIFEFDEIQQCSTSLQNDQQINIAARIEQAAPIAAGGDKGHRKTCLFLPSFP